MTKPIPCRFSLCESPATGIYFFPAGCVCWADQVQALCAQHAYTATPQGRLLFRIAALDAFKQLLAAAQKQDRLAPSKTTADLIDAIAAAEEACQ